jgi:RNA polymerase sigma-70 factor (ECF subfamily)
MTMIVAGREPAHVEPLVRAHYGSIVAFAHRALGDSAEACEIAQETAARAIAGQESYDPSRPFAPWILSIAANLVRDRFRRRRPAALEETDLPAVELPPDARLIREEDRARVLAALATLPDEQRLVVAMIYTEDRAPADVAQALGISLNAVRIRLFRALARLREALRETP